MSKVTEAEPQPDHRMGLGRRVIVFRRTPTYTVVALLSSLGILSVAVAVFFYVSVTAAIVAVVVLLWLGVFIRAQRRAQLIVYQNGLYLTNGRSYEVALWEDVADIKPAFSGTAHPNNLITLTIRRQSGGGFVIRNNWSPRPEFLALIERLLRWTEA